MPAGHTPDPSRRSHPRSTPQVTPQIRAPGTPNYAEPRPLADPGARYTDLGSDFYGTRINPERRRRNHIR